jgi:hypothetical protein
MRRKLPLVGDFHRYGKEVAARVVVMPPVELVDQFAHGVSFVDWYFNCTLPVESVPPLPVT